MTENQAALPGEGLKTEKMPGHWVLAQMGKRVLRPGGIELTWQMLDALAIGNDDHVVEFAPGLGATAQRTLQRAPASYTAVERDEQAAKYVRAFLTHSSQQVVRGNAEETGLPTGSATVVYGEAMLSMQPAQVKARIFGEAFRLLKPNGRYAIHELCLTPDHLDASTKDEIHRALSNAIHAGVRPLTPQEWRTELEAAGFTIAAEAHAPMHLLEPRRLVQDEGLGGALRFFWNVVRNKESRKRILAMRGVFRKYGRHLAAIMLVAHKTGGADE
jgi:SAM-dependent methyltransferase